MDTMSDVLQAPARDGVRWGAATLVLAGTLTVMAGATVAPAIPQIRSAFTGTANADLLSRLIITIPALAIAVFAPLAGGLIDRIGRKRALVIGALTFALGGSSGAYLPDLYAILAGRVVLGAGVSLVMTSSVALIADLYDGPARQRLIGRQQAATAFGGVVFLLGGGILASVGWRNVFLIYLLAVLLVAPALVYLPGSPARPQRARDAGPLPPVGRGLPREILAPVAAMLLMQIIFYSVPTQIPFLVTGKMGGGSITAGAVIAALTFTVGMVAMRFAFIRGRAGEHTLVSVSFLGIGLGCLVLYAAGSVAVLVIGLLIMAAGLGTLAPTLNNWVIMLARPHTRGRYVGFLTAALFLGQFLSPIVTEPIAGALGIQPSFAVLAVATLPIATVYFSLGWRSARPERKEIAE